MEIEEVGKKGSWTISLRSLLWAVLIVLLLNFAVMVVLQFQVGARNKNIATVEEVTNSVKATAEDTQRIVHDFEVASKNQAKALGTDAIVAHLQQSIDNGKTLQEIKLELQDFINRLERGEVRP